MAQFHILPGELQTNLARALEMINAAARLGSNLVLLPELWSSGYDLEHAARHAATTPNILSALTDYSHSHHLHIAGSLLDNTSGALANTLFWQSPDENQAWSYSKIHLFRLMDEPKWLRSGEHLTQVPAPWGETGLAVCYDLRFPELFRSYAMNGAQAFVLCAEWPSRRITHWQTLLRARAIENQAFVFAVNCVGKSAQESFGGRSAVISPWGETLVEGSLDEEELLTVEIDASQIEEARKFMPVFQDRRPDLYTHK